MLIFLLFKVGILVNKLKFGGMREGNNYNKRFIVKIFWFEFFRRKVRVGTVEDVFREGRRKLEKFWEFICG